MATTYNNFVKRKKEKENCAWFNQWLDLSTWIIEESSAGAIYQTNTIHLRNHAYRKIREPKPAKSFILEKVKYSGIGAPNLNRGQKMALTAIYFINFHRSCGHITVFRALSAIYFWPLLKTTDWVPYWTNLGL